MSFIIPPAFTAIDFETANQSRSSACQLGLALVENGRVTEVKSWLIKPPTPEFIFTYLHGIDYRMVRSQLTFGELWPQLKPYIENKIIAAHNASFDIGVLRACLQHYHLPLPEFQYVDSVAIARKTWPQLPNHKLNTVAGHLNLVLQHHEAASDAQACAQIICQAGWRHAAVRR